MAGPIKGIYKITSPTGRVYIGQSVNIYARFKRYRDINCRSQRKLHRSLLKYGHKSHRFQIIHELPDDTTKDVLNVYEGLYIDAHKECGYKMLNIKEAGSAGAASKETRIRQSIALKGREVKSLPMASIISEYLSGHTMGGLSEKYQISHNTLLRRLKKELGPARVASINRDRKIISLNKVAKKFKPGFIPWNKGASVGSGIDNNFYGKTHTLSSKEKMRSQKEKKVVCNNNGVEYASTIDAASKLGLNQSSIAKVARGVQKQHKGYTFKYL